MKITEGFRQFGAAIFTLLYPPHCVECNADQPAGSHLCETCGKGARRIVAPYCATCSQPFDGALEGEFSCSNCAGRKFHFECAIAPYRSHGVVREILHRFKYQGKYFLRHELGAWMAEGLDDPRLDARKFAFIVPVPLHRSRERERQFNQAAVLAALLSKRADVPVAPVLQRIRSTTTQTRLDRASRMENLLNAFRMRKNTSVQGKDILLVDDVFTTGSTVNECARTLKNAGAASVCVLAVARG